MSVINDLVRKIRKIAVLGFILFSVIILAGTYILHKNLSQIKKTEQDLFLKNKMQRIWKR